MRIMPYKKLSISLGVLALLFALTTRSPGQASPHGPMKLACQTCHTTDSWKMSPSAAFDHASVGFALSGRHATIECAACHRDLRFSGLSPNCLTCHTDVHRSELGNDCARCHSPQMWQIPDMRERHQLTRFPLVGQHATLACEACHASTATHQYTGVPTTCIGCHRKDFEAAKNPNHMAQGFSPQCAKCHRSTAPSWGGTFDHSLTQFPLTGSHLAVNCLSCHKNQTFASTPMQCYACHKNDFTTSRNPNHVAAGFTTDCQTCHTTAVWSTGRFDHNTTGFPLIGAHRTQSCEDCHGNNVYAGHSTDCYGCHQSSFTGTTNPNHAAGGFSHECQTCHTTSAWRPSTFSHAGTRFPLTGAHLSVACSDCHVNNRYQGLTTVCYDCHTSNFTATTNPNHVAGNFNHDCTMCHSTTSWSGASFNHAQTNFPLTGAHTSLACLSCHTGNNYQLVYTDCYQCHQAQYQGVTNPNHVAGGFSHDCTQCHNANSWGDATFNHNSTNFPLTGAHTTTPCQSCHVGGNYQLTYTDCYQCHQADYQRVTDPNHVAGGFSHDCTQCHNTSSWDNPTFNHNSTNFPLTGAHTTTPCQSCHVGGNYQLRYSDCYQCHQAQFQGVTDPNHVAGNFSHNCTPCHSTTLWSPATFSHNSTNFPLTGAHASATCQSCHIGGNYQLTYTDCYQCHQTQFTQPTNPNHVAGNFGHNCTPCHTTNAWTPSTFSHNSTNFPLTGAHQAVACNSCHINNVYQGLPSACYDCHSGDFNGTTNPNHVAGNFSHDCTQCHTTNGWSPATFNHAQTNFPLTGAHTSAACQSCHINGNYQLTYTDCYQCHATQFAQPTNPNHVALLFSHNCTPCHTTNAWLPSTFNHDTQFFRIYSGAHQNRWTQCSQCHPSLGNYDVFTCTTCHTQPDMDDQHRGVQGYIYSSPACYSCHRNV